MSRKETPFLRLFSIATRNRMKSIIVAVGAKLNPLFTANPTLGAKMFPYNPSGNEYVVVPSKMAGLERDAEGEPIPPREIRIGEMSGDEFLRSGKEDVDAMNAILAHHRMLPPDGGRVLEFGCSAGRQLRHLRPYLMRGEVWGVDLATEHIFWIQQHLDPRFRVAAVTSSPHLPFRDGTFDLIYAGSVFTHLDDLADAWFLELKRITRTGGVLYLTMHDTDTLTWMVEHRQTVPWADMVLGSDAYRRFSTEAGRFFTVGRSLHSYVFYDTAWLRQHLSQNFEVLDVVPGVFRGLQSAWLLRVTD